MLPYIHSYDPYAAFSLECSLFGDSTNHSSLGSHLQLAKGDTCMWRLAATCTSGKPPAVPCVLSET